MGESFKREKKISREEENKNWEDYHQSRSDLYKALDKHYKLIETVNPYSHYNDGSWEMMNDSMGKNKIVDMMAHGMFDNVKKV